MWLWSVHNEPVPTQLTHLKYYVGFTVLVLLLPALILLHLLVAPYTKVEESFHIQATHDILLHGFPFDKPNLNRENYDHFTFPGAVPRTAVGAAVLAKLSQPVVALANGLHSHGQHVEGFNGTTQEQLGLGGLSGLAMNSSPLARLSQYIPSVAEGDNQQILGVYP